MIGHTKQLENGRVEEILEREHLWEWLFFDCDPTYWNNHYFRNFEIASYIYIPFHNFYPDRSTMRVFLFVIYPFVVAWRWFMKKWFNLARLVYFAGFLRYEHGKMVPFFWPKLITFRRIGARCEVCRKWFVSPDRHDRFCRNCFK